MKLEKKEYFKLQNDIQKDIEDIKREKRENPDKGMNIGI